MEDLGEMDCPVLKRLLKDDGAKCLLLDCRSFLAFSAGHIRGAVNARCNTIVRRRAKGSALSLEQILAGDEEVRGRLRSGMYSAAVLYDERTPDSEAVKADSTLTVVLNALWRDASGTHIYLLKGERRARLTTSRDPSDDPVQVTGGGWKHDGGVRLHFGAFKLRLIQKNHLNP